MSFSLLSISKSSFHTDMSTNVCFNGPNISMMSFPSWMPGYIFIPVELFSSQVLSYYFPGVTLPKVMWIFFFISTLIWSLGLWHFAAIWISFPLHWNSLQSQEKKCWCFFCFQKLWWVKTKYDQVTPMQPVPTFLLR